MNKEKLYSLLHNIDNNLNPYGYIVLRRLNGDYELNEIVKKYFTIDNKRPSERSEFYKETIICYKN